MTPLSFQRSFRSLLAVGSALVLLSVSGCSSLPLVEPSYSAVPTPPRLQSNAPPEVQKPSHFPDKPLTLLVGFAKGADGDIAARAMIPRLERWLNQPVVVVNRPDATGQDVWTQLKMAKPDGYTMAVIQSPQLPMATAGVGAALVSLQDFVPVAGQLQDPEVLFVRGLSPFKSVAELIVAAKAQPDGLSAGVSGSADTLALAEFQRRAGIKLRVTRYPDPLTARMSTISGQVEICFGSLSSMASTVRAGQGRFLAILDGNRSPDFPDVPTMRESGMDATVLSTTGYALPKGASTELQEYLAWSLYVAISDPSHQSTMKDAGQPVHFIPQAPFRKLLADEAVRAKELQADLR